MSLGAMLADVEQLVTCESPTADLAATARCAEVVAALGERRLGAAPERSTVDGRTHLRWRFGSGDRVVLLGHFDTVWPIGTLDRLPFSVTDGVIRGPGCFDMKAGLVMLLHALAAVPDLDGVTVLATSDEEIGSPTSRQLIEESARGAAAALVLEASAPGGALKTARKGASSFRVEITGRAAHAGLEPEIAASAAVELAHQVLAIAGLADPALGTSVTPTVLAAGTTTNTVPDAAVVADSRAFTVAEQHRVADALAALKPVVDGTSVRAVLEVTRPPLPTSASAALFARAAGIAARLGLPALTGIAVGGGSDGNLTAGVGTPTLDGLGAVGGGAHADDEHALVAALSERAALVAALVADLLAG